MKIIIYKHKTENKIAIYKGQQNKFLFKGIITLCCPISKISNTIISLKFFDFPSCSTSSWRKIDDMKEYLQSLKRYLQCIPPTISSRKKYSYMVSFRESKDIYEELLREYKFFELSDNLLSNDLF